MRQIIIALILIGGILTIDEYLTDQKEVTPSPLEFPAHEEWENPFKDGDIIAEVLQENSNYAKDESRGFDAITKDGFVHRGYDIVMPVNTPLYSPCVGTVQFKTQIGGGGLMVDVPCFPEEELGNFRFGFAHLNKYPDGLKDGDYVYEGDLIGYSGGHPNYPVKQTSTGPHLHFSIKSRYVFIPKTKLYEELKLDHLKKYLNINFGAIH